MKQDKTKWIIWALALIVIVLGLLVLYAFVLRPQLSGYVINAQNQGVQLAVATIMRQAATCQTVPLTLENQTINLVAVECLQQAQQQTANQSA